MIALAIFLSYSLQFYAVVDYFWQKVKSHCGQHENLGENLVRIGVVVSIRRLLLESVSNAQF